jgi:hypothetical protein
LHFDLQQNGNKQQYSVVREFVNARINLAILRATNLCIRGSRVPASKMSKQVQWHDGAGLGLFETMTSLKDGTLPQTNSSSLIETSDKPISTSFPNHKNALQRVTNYNQDQPIDFDPYGGIAVRIGHYGIKPIRSSK